MSQSQDSVWEHLDDDSKFDAQGMALPVEQTDEGESGSSASPEPDAAAAAAKAGTENTTASQPSPGTAPAEAAKGPATTEDKSGAAAAAGKPGEAAKPASAEPPAGKEQTPEEEEATLKQQFGKPDDKGEEWRIRAFRAGQEIKKKLGPVQDRIDRIGSPDRVARGLDAVEALAEPETPITDAWLKMTALSTSRAQELHDYLYEETLKTYPDQVATDLLSDDGKPVTVAEAKAAVKAAREGTAGRAQTQPQSAAGAPAPVAVDVTKIEVPKPDDMTDEQWGDFKLDYPVAYKAMQQQIADVDAAKAQAAAPAAAEAKPEEDPEKKELATKVQTFEEKERQALIDTAVKEIETEGSKLYEEAFSVVDEGLRELGLVPDPQKHDARTISLITDTAKSIRDAVEPEFDGPDGPEGPMDWSRCSEEQKENRKLVQKTMTLLAQRDFAAARDYLEVIKARADLAFQRVAAPKMDLYNAAMLQPTDKTRTAAQTGHERKEIVGGTAAGGMSSGDTNAKAPWLDPSFRKDGEGAFEAMERYMETHDTLPGRT
jgi:hypothetical protein